MWQTLDKHALFRGRDFLSETRTLEYTVNLLRQTGQVSNVLARLRVCGVDRLPAADAHPRRIVEVLRQYLVLPDSAIRLDFAQPVSVHCAHEILACVWPLWLVGSQELCRQFVMAYGEQTCKPYFWAQSQKREACLLCVQTNAALPTFIETWGEIGSPSLVSVGIESEQQWQLLMQRPTADDSRGDDPRAPAPKP